MAEPCGEAHVQRVGACMDLARQHSRTEILVVSRNLVRTDNVGALFRGAECSYGRTLGVFDPAKARLGLRIEVEVGFPNQRGAAYGLDGLVDIRPVCADIGKRSVVLHISLRTAVLRDSSPLDI